MMDRSLASVTHTNVMDVERMDSTMLLRATNSTAHVRNILNHADGAEQIRLAVQKDRTKRTISK